ncbi:unnamed protein product [Linum trigynum]|uniref:Retrotransposon Copia-like N-terminal domain-containing protein n=1 Tax=Linum trigynum TaxID=586398 RepID=A0AAV2EAH6_9ROSI
MSGTRSGGANTPPNTPPVNFGSFQGQSTNTQGNSNRAADLNFGNPFYINPNENLAQSIVPIVLDGPNYQTWSKAVKVVLKTKNKLGFIDGSIVAPNRNDNLFQIWDACNTIVLCWITNSLEKDISRSVLSHDNARALWNEHKDHYGQADAQKLTNLEDEIHSTKQGTKTITQYYTHMKGLWEEYSQFNLIVPYGCLPGNPLPCAAVEPFRLKHNTDYLIRFLRGLNPEYDYIRTQQLMQKALPTVVHAFHDLLQHEQKLKAEGNGAGNKISQSVALTAGSYSGAGSSNANSTAKSSYKGSGETGTYKGSGENDQLFCNYCKKTTM